MELPQVDEFRKPFVEPLGHLTMQAAYAELRLIELCASPALPEAPTIGVAGHKIRNWGEKARKFVQKRIEHIQDEGIRNSAFDAVGRYDQTRQQRHRAIHDAIDVGIDGNADDGYAIVLLGTQTIAKSHNQIGGTLYRDISVEPVAALACELEDIQKTIEFIVWQLERQLVIPDNE